MNTSSHVHFGSIAALPGVRTPSAQCLAEISDLLALGLLRHRRKLARTTVAASPRQAEKPLDDVAPRARVRTTENRTPKNGGNA